MVAHYKVESRHHPQPLGRPRTRVTYPLRDRHSPGENKPGVKVGQGAGTLTLRHAIPPPRASKLSFWMENIILHFVYCVPKLHIHHAATQEGWTSVSAPSATVLRGYFGREKRMSIDMCASLFQFQNIKPNVMVSLSWEWALDV